MLKKSKLLIGFSSGATAVSSVVAPISVALANSSFTNPYEQYFKFDDENGFDDRWFEQFVESFENTIVSQIILPSTKSQQWKDIQVKHLKQKIESYRTKLEELKQTNATATMAYTVTSNAMIDDAYESYVDDFGKHVKIYRSSRRNVTFDDIETLYEQQKNSIVINMENAGIDPEKVEFFKKDADKQFDIMYSHLVQQYADPLAAMYKAKAKFATLFAAANKEVAFLGASQALSDFLMNHTFEFNTNNGDSNCLDTLMNSAGKYDEELGKEVKFEAGNDISVWMNDIFVIKNSITGRPVNFNKTKVIPGFKTYPVLKEIKIDKLTNDHKIDIDWRCVKDCYINTEYETTSTAHLYSPSADALSERYEECLAGDTSFEHMFKEEDAVMMTYDIPLTNNAEVSNFKEAYLGAGNRLKVSGLRFSWDEPEKCSFDPFITGDIIESGDTNGTITVSVNAKGLAQSGLRVQVFGENNAESEWYRLDEILAPNGYEGCDEVTQTSKAGNDDVDTEIAKSAISDFLENCSLKGICTFDKSFTKHDVHVELCAWYSNTQGKTDDDREKTKISIGTFNLENLPFTKVLYHDLSVRYNGIRSQVEQYANCSIINPLYINMGDEKTSRIVSMSLTIGLSSLATGLMFIPFMRPSSKIILGAYIALTAADIAIAGASYGIWKDKIYKPVDELHSRILAFSKTSLCRELMAEIEEDGRKYNIVSAKLNDHGILEMNKKEYDDNFENKFVTATGINYDGLIEFHKKYSSLDTFPKMDEFLDALDEAEICPWDVEEVSDNCTDNSSYAKAVKVLDLTTTSITIAELAVTAIDLCVATFMAVKQWIALRKMIRLNAQGKALATAANRKALWAKATAEALKAKTKKVTFIPTKLSPISEVANEAEEIFEEIKPAFRDAIEEELHTTTQGVGEVVTEDIACEYTVKKMFINTINPIATKEELRTASNFDKFLSLGIKETTVNPRTIISKGEELRFLMHHGKYYEVGRTFLTMANNRLVNIPKQLSAKVMFSPVFQEGAEGISAAIINTVRKNIGILHETGENAILSYFWKAAWKELVISAASKSVDSTGAEFFVKILKQELAKTGKCLTTASYKDLEGIFDIATMEMFREITQRGGQKMSLEGALVFNRAFSSGIRSVAMKTFYATGEKVVFIFA